MPWFQQMDPLIKHRPGWCINLVKQARMSQVATWAGVNTEWNRVTVNTHRLVVPFFRVELCCFFSVIAPAPKTRHCTDYSSSWCLMEFEIKGTCLLYKWSHRPLRFVALTFSLFLFLRVPLSPRLLLSRFPLHKRTLIHMWLHPITSPSLAPVACLNRTISLPALMPVFTTLGLSVFFSFSLSPFVFSPSSHLPLLSLILLLSLRSLLPLFVTLRGVFTDWNLTPGWIWNSKWHSIETLWIWCVHIYMYSMSLMLFSHWYNEWRVLPSLAERTHTNTCTFADTQFHTCSVCKKKCVG